MSDVSKLPRFNHIDYETVPHELEKLLTENRRAIDDIVNSTLPRNWLHLMEPLDDLDDIVNHFWSPISHLNSVLNSKPLRDSYQQCLPMLSQYSAEIGQNSKLYHAIETMNLSGLNCAQKKIREDELLAFKLSGVALEEEEQQRFKEIQARLSELSNQFDNNILDATQAWFKLVNEESMLVGLPEHTIATAHELAQEKSKTGWLLSLEFPCYYAVMTYADNRELRQEMYLAYITRASELGPSGGEYDNSNVIDEILALRHEKSQLLGYSNFAGLSLATKMAESTEQVMEFMQDLSKRAIKQAEQEYQALERFAYDEFQLDELQAWDVTYYSEKLRQHKFKLSQEELRPYFPQPKVMQGMFEIVNRLYGISLSKCEGIETWHPDVEFYEMYDASGVLRGLLYVDLYARVNKRGGAWMDECQVRRKLADESIQLPVAFLTCNFAPASEHLSACLSHNEVVTLFHEFGHCLHHLLTQVDYAAASGINGVEWDAVELPSQFFENWCWQQAALELISEHVETKQALPIEYIEKLEAAKNFQSSMAMIRQLEFSLFDFKIHLDYKPGEKNFVQHCLDEVRKDVSVVPCIDDNRFQHSFSHIFAGGYAAGYYSYKWAEVLSSDAFDRFEQEGIFNQHTGRDFLHFILERGGSAKALDLFIGFRGRKPKVDALLKHSGIR